MTIKITNGLSPEWYALGADPETRFHLRPLTEAEKLDVQMEYDASRKSMTGRGVMIAVRSCVLEWEGIVGADGKTLPYSLDTLERLPVTVLAEVGSRIFQLSFHTEAQVKN
jgi:hypothetical protein